MCESADQYAKYLHVVVQLKLAQGQKVNNWCISIGLVMSISI